MNPNDNKPHNSFAEWPKGTAPYSNDITSDRHATKANAEAVCDLLRENGFGGDGKVFPIRTWTEPA